MVMLRLKCDVAAANEAVLNQFVAMFDRDWTNPANKAPDPGLTLSPFEVAALIDIYKEHGTEADLSEMLTEEIGI